MKNLRSSLFFAAFATAVGFSSCVETNNCANVTCPTGQVCLDGTCITTTDNFLVSSNITSDVTWTADKIYELGGRIAVESGATLTIEPGTIIKGQAGTGANATALLIAKGAKIMAQGTAAKPIIFTTVADEISIADVTAGNFASPNMDATANGLWGGLIILGNAPISASSASIQIEGIPASDQNGLYGGSDATDNSGTLQYVSIRHGGTNIGSGNEINGLTLGGVGSGTTIDHIEIVGNQDDGIEFFGGTVNVSDLLILNAGDDAVDTDQEWAGTLDNFIVIGGADTDHALELDGGEGTITNVKFTLQNGSCKGWRDGDDNTGGEYADLRSKVQCNLSSVYFFNFGESSDFELDAGDNSTTSTVSDNFTNGDITFTGLKLKTNHLTTGNVTIADIFKDKHSTLDAFSGLTTTEADIVTAKTGGADKTKFTGWSWASEAGLLTDF